MPIYEYQCDHCGVFEVSQRITEDPLKKCPTCKAKVRRLISNTSFLLKGNGWYATDYGRSKTSTESSTNGKSAESSSASSEKSSGSSEKSSGTSEKSSGGEKAASSSS
jgi:putative FmdB family regulatory protein